MEKQPAVYIVASARNGTIYTGVTSHLLGRVHQHRTGEVEGFTKRYHVRRLVWFEPHEIMESAIVREKRIKNWPRRWKLDLIEKDNPTWRDLAEDFGFAPLPQALDGSTPHRQRSTASVWDSGS
ncbi:GIY-YIG nuclease family protein [Hephaestia caeni]|nr:GIY-YIG nuclease family protein [Hephaestia caeni]